MKKIVLYSLLTLVSSACAKEYVCYQEAKELNPLLSVTLGNKDCWGDYKKPEAAVAKKIGEQFYSPNIAMNSRLVTCCKERSSEAVVKPTTLPDGKLDVNMGKLFIVNV